MLMRFRFSGKSFFCFVFQLYSYIIPLKSGRFAVRSCRECFRIGLSLRPRFRERPMHVLRCLTV